MSKNRVSIRLDVNLRLRLQFTDEASRMGLTCLRGGRIVSGDMSGDPSSRPVKNTLLSSSKLWSSGSGSQSCFFTSRHCNALHPFISSIEIRCPEYPLPSTHPGLQHVSGGSHHGDAQRSGRNVVHHHRLHPIRRKTRRPCNPKPIRTIKHQLLATGVRMDFIEWLQAWANFQTEQFALKDRCY